MTTPDTEAPPLPRVSEVLTTVAEHRRNGASAEPADDSAPPSPDPLSDRAWVRANEDALFAAIEQRQTTTIWTPFKTSLCLPMPDGTAEPVILRVRGLSQKELDEVERKSKLPTGNREAGTGRPELIRNATRYSHELIIAATHPEDAARLWASESARRHFKVGSAADMVRLVLLPGEVQRVGAEIVALTGFIPPEEEVAKSLS